ncbi:Transmembrane and TPR repeat-containing protein 2 [Hypsibius exemplaris]|uniref:dolichyl-phosphate-mannose--protein mannosyltransferase n=1 Tax=Hypsibius exemplaris TaxID=2072580 RepID=A0A1W0WR07_HYPEX|nr:Transmembrane and TPR repeat-containing protein 2 [Hypsibius exemplaris]
MKDLLGILSVPVLAGLVYWNTLQAQFAYDDNRAILENGDLRAEQTPFLQLWLNDFWGTPLRHPGSHKSFRPACVATFRWNYSLHGLSPRGYHAVNVAIHAVNCLLFLLTITKITGNRKLAILAGLAFAAHPIHTEAVAGVVGRADLGACLFFLVSLLCYIHYCEQRDQVLVNAASLADDQQDGILLFAGCGWMARQALWLGDKWQGLIIPALLGATCGAALLSCLFKETGITVLGVCVFYDLVLVQGHHHHHRSLPELIRSLTKKVASKRLEGIVLLSCWLGVVVALRCLWMGSSPPQFAGSDNPAAEAGSWLTRALTFGYLPVLNVMMLIDPRVLSYDWSMDAVPLVTRITDRRNITSALFYSSLYWLVRCCLRMGISRVDENAMTQEKSPPWKGEPLLERSTSNRLLLAMALIAIPFLPASNIFFYVGFVMAERILYIPSMGFCWLVAEGLIKAFNYSRNPLSRGVIAAGFAGLLVAHSSRTWLRNGDWLTEEALYLSGAVINPAKSWSNLGNIWSQRGRLKESEVAYIKALKHRPNMADAHYNLGLLLQDQRRFNESIASYGQAIHFRHNMAVAHLNLALALQSTGRPRDAEATYRKCAHLDVSTLKDPKLHESAKITCLYNLGRLLADEREFEKAITVYMDAVNKMPSFYAPQGLYNMLGEAYFQLNRPDLAEHWYKLALQTKPDHAPAHLTYARFLYKQNRTMAAEKIFAAVFNSTPVDPAAYHFYGQYLMDSGRLDDAVRVAVKAAELYPNHFQSLTDAAGALRQSGNHAKSEFLYRRAAAVDPFQVSGHINLGAILHLNGQHKAAEESYLRALQLDSKNSIAVDNLQKLRSLMRRSPSSSGGGMGKTRAPL